MKSAISLSAVFAFACSVAALDEPRDLNTLRTFPNLENRKDWQQRAQDIRNHVQFCTGLWPMPAKTPLNAEIFDRVERDGYTIEKVYFQTYPGFFLAGNLYRPFDSGANGKTKSKGPFPAILNPHGHWKNGRMADEESGSIAARCITFARQGMIAFSYDMAGYNDTIQVDHKFGSAPTNLLWNISLMGLQTWNIIRALDFLESLPDVDKKRLACTGESGGGTQTFILGAIDDRLAAQAPIVMVSHSMQGGCLCENAPGLRVDYSNMEIAAAPAPRPQVIVAATGDWTKKMMEVEGPAIESVYHLFGAEEKFDYAIFDYEHNYNKTTREFVYGSLGKWLLKEKNPERLKEGAYTKEPDEKLRVFPDGKLPDGALKEPELIQSLIAMYSAQLNEIKPVDAKSLKRWKKEMLPAWEHALQLRHVGAEVEIGGAGVIAITRAPDGDKVQFADPDLGKQNGGEYLVIVVGPAGKSALEETLRKEAIDVVRLAAREADSPDLFKNYFHTYNRTPVQDTVADIKVLTTHLRQRFPRRKLILAGEGAGGFAALAAAPLVDAMIADGAGLDESKDAEMLDKTRFFPGVRRIGSLQGMMALAAPNPVFVHNIKSWEHDWITKVYAKEEGKFRTQADRASDEEVVRWIRNLSER